MLLTAREIVELKIKSVGEHASREARKRAEKQALVLAKEAAELVKAKAMREGNPAKAQGQTTSATSAARRSTSRGTAQSTLPRWKPKARAKARRVRKARRVPGTCPKTSGDT